MKLITTAEVRVRPVDLPEPAAPLFDVWAGVDNIAVEDWARNPGTARDELEQLLGQVAAELAKSYRERTFGAP